MTYCLAIFFAKYCLLKRSYFRPLYFKIYAEQVILVETLSSNENKFPPWTRSVATMSMFLHTENLRDCIIFELQG
jgi:hypothetical protein